jgi:hypothetical protein
VTTSWCRDTRKKSRAVRLRESIGAAARWCSRLCRAADIRVSIIVVSGERNRSGLAWPDVRAGNGQGRYSPTRPSRGLLGLERELRTENRAVAALVVDLGVVTERIAQPVPHERRRWPTFEPKALALVVSDGVAVTAPLASPPSSVHDPAGAGTSWLRARARSRRRDGGPGDHRRDRDDRDDPTTNARSVTGAAPEAMTPRAGRGPISAPVPSDRSQRRP